MVVFTKNIDFRIINTNFHTRLDLKFLKYQLSCIQENWFLSQTLNWCVSSIVIVSIINSTYTFFKFC